MTGAVTHEGSERIVVGLDGSPSSIRALRWAAHYASMTGQTVEVIVVWDWYRAFGGYTLILAGLDPKGDATRVLKKALKQIKSEWPDVSMTSQVVEGHPSPILADASKGATMLIVGSRGHGEFTGMLIGSVSEYCATHAHCPVLVHRGS
jgi:nucleotide-binding universal stress UspA family protein